MEECGKERLISLLLTIDQQDLESPAMLDAIDWGKLNRLVRDPDEPLFALAAVQGSGASPAWALP